MQRKLKLERFQKENLGFDFNEAEIPKGGPDSQTLRNNQYSFYSL
jgi:hypothetical protein